MDAINEFLNQYALLSYVTPLDMIIRIILSCALVFPFALERDTKNKPINFRAYMIVSMTACMMGLLGQELGHEFVDYDGIMNMDLGKVVSGTLTGIGFLGAGAIMRLGDNRVIGTSTGASVWASGGIGLSIGFGYYALAVTGTIVLTIVLIGGGFFMREIRDQKDHEKQEHYK